MVASHKAIASAFKDEPMVIGYDLRNEPYLGTVAGIRYPAGQQPPILTTDFLAKHGDLVSAKLVREAARTAPRVAASPWHRAGQRRRERHGRHPVVGPVRAEASHRIRHRDGPCGRPARRRTISAMSLPPLTRASRCGAGCRSKAIRCGGHESPDHRRLRHRLRRPPFQPPARFCFSPRLCAPA